MAISPERRPEDDVATILHASSMEALGHASASAFRPLVGRRDEVIVNELTDAGSYKVLVASAAGVGGMTGEVSDHPILSHIADPRASSTIRPDNEHLRSDLVRHLRVGGIREAIYIPLIEADRLLGCVLVLRRGLFKRSVVAKASRILSALSSALLRFRLEQELALATERERSAVETAALLVAGVRGIDRATSADEVVGQVLRATANLDDALIGAVVGRVSEGTVVDTAAMGTTPRTSVQALEGTRLDGFPIGRQLLAEVEPIFADADEASHATRTRIMEPIGAASLLAAAGRDGETVRLVLSAYRSRPDAPAPWVLSAIEATLEYAAQTVGRLERDGRFHAVTSALEDGVVVFGTEGNVVYANPATADLLGTPPGVEQGATESGWTTLSGEALNHDEGPVQRALAGGETRSVLRWAATGRAHRVTALPLGGGGAVMTIRDVTDEIDADAPDADVRDMATERSRRTL